MQPDFSKVTSDIFTLASLTDNLPIINTPDGEFVPLRALCEIVGLRPSSYIGVFCAHFKGHPALKRLPWQSPTGLQQAWCLKQKHLPYWIIVVPYYRVPEDRRERLLALQEQCAHAMGYVYNQQQQEFQKARSDLFQTLNCCRDMEQRIQSIARLGFRLPTPEQWRETAKRIAEGQRILDELADLTRKTLANMLQLPVVDGYVLDENNVATDTISFPIFPIVPRAELANIFKLALSIMNWADQTMTWLSAQIDEWEKRVGLDGK